MSEDITSRNVIIIGGGAAGLMASIQLARLRTDLQIRVLDGAKRLGAKILISGGGRCNVTNQSVSEKDFHGGSRNVIKRILKSFSAEQTAEFFDSIGVPLHAEEHGKLFPDSNKARTVLNALIETAERNGVQLVTNQRVEKITRQSRQFSISCANGEFLADRIVLSTGGKSVPKTGSDGFGYELSRSLGHSVSPTFPALAPLLLDAEFHQSLSGISQEVELTLLTNGHKPQRFRGSLLWTHFGISGPVVLDLSRHWHLAKANEQAPQVVCNFEPADDFQSVDARLLQWTKSTPGASLRRQLATRFPARFVDALLQERQIPQDTLLCDFPRQHRRELVHALTQRELLVNDSRGFQYAEATAGGVPLSEINPSTMESRLCEHLYFAGEILDVDGRLGGFNFQWAWSSATVAARGIAASYESER